VQGNRLQVVVNRYNKTAPVSLRDIAEALRGAGLRKLPNDYVVVSESQNTGVPLELHAPRAPVTLAMRELCQELLGTEVATQGLLKRTFGRLFGG
jgi:pilus assembly protein CpaE